MQSKLYFLLGFRLSWLAHLWEKGCLVNLFPLQQLENALQRRFGPSLFHVLGTRPFLEQRQLPRTSSIHSSIGTSVSEGVPELSDSILPSHLLPLFCPSQGPQVLLFEEQDLLLALDPSPAELEEIQQLTGFLSVLSVV